MDGHKKKFIILAIIISVVALICVLIFIFIKSSSSPKPDNLSSEKLYTDTSMERLDERISELAHKAPELDGQEIQVYFDYLIAKETDPVVINSLKLAYAGNMTSHAFVYKTSQILESIDVDSLLCPQKTSYYIRYRMLYQSMSDIKKATEYHEKSQESVEACDREGWER